MGLNNRWMVVFPCKVLGGRLAAGAESIRDLSRFGHL